MAKPPLILAFFALITAACKEAKSDLSNKELLSKPLTEISGLAADGQAFWAITDKPHAVVFKINVNGKVEQEVKVKNSTAVDVEAVTKDDGFVYIGDVGDNEGNRDERQIFKVAKSALGNSKKAEVDGELITFRFADDFGTDKKKRNNFDCESLLSFGDSLYVFTKRRGDMQSELFSIPKTPGNFTARSLGTFDSKGLITDAAINKANNEVALIGYTKGHKFPFILLFKNFQGNNFFSGKSERVELADKPWDWQTESLTYSDGGEMFFACEETKEVKSTLYGIKRDNLWKLNKKR